MKIYLLMLIVINLYAKHIYLADTQKCKVFFDDENISQIFIEDFCKLENKNSVIDKIKETYEHEPRPNFDSFIKHSKPLVINYKNKKLQAYRLDATTGQLLLTTPLYATFRFRGKKLTFYGYVSKYDANKYGLGSKYDLAIVDEYDEKFYKKHLDVINSIPRAIEIQQITTPMTYAYMLVDSLIGDKEVDIKKDGWDKIFYSAKSYDDVVRKYIDVESTASENYLVNFLKNKEFMNSFSFEQKLEIMQSIKKHIDKKFSVYIFNIYSILSTNQYSLVNETKNIKYQIDALKYLNTNYDKYENLYIDNTKDKKIMHWQPDLYGEAMISSFKKSVKDKSLIKTYTNEMRKLYTRAREDISYYNIQTIIGALSSNEYKYVHPYLKKIYEKKLLENKKVKYHLGLMNVDERKYINIEFFIDTTKTKKILDALKKDGEKLTYYRSSYTKSFDVKMGKDEVIKKLLELYNLKLSDVEILESSITLVDKKL